MKPHFLASATVALVTMTAIPAWAVCDDTSSVREPGSATMAESNADAEMDADKGNGEHLLAEEIAVEDLEKAEAEGDEDPAPEGYTTNVPPEKMIDTADVGETTPADSLEKSEDQMAGAPASLEKKTKPMKTEAESNGEYAEQRPEDQQASMSNADETTEKVAELTEETTVGEGGKIEAATGGAEPEENWFGCNPDGDESEGDTCEKALTEASPDPEADPEPDYASLDREKPVGGAAALSDDCEDEKG